MKIIWTTSIGEKNDSYLTAASIDEWGNIYAGTASDKAGVDMIIEKVSPNGKILWDSSINSYWESIDSISPDNKGSLYVFAGERGIKISSKTGEVAWEKRLVSKNAGTQEGRFDISVLGGIYTAFSGSKELERQYPWHYGTHIAEISNTGETVWMTSINQSEVGDSGLDRRTSIVGIESTKTGIVIAADLEAGEIDGYTPLSSFDGFISRLDQNGSLEWTEFQQKNNPESHTVRYHDLVADQRENIYVLGGGFSVNGGIFDNSTIEKGWFHFVSKFDQDGNKVWTHVFEDAIQNYDILGSISLTPNDNVLIGGLDREENHAYIAKLSPKGNLKSINKYSNVKLTGYRDKIALLPLSESRLYVAGSSRDGDGRNAFISLVDFDSKLKDLKGNNKRHSIKLPVIFKRKFVDEITNFKASVDSLGIDGESFGIPGSATFASGKNKKEVKKKLAELDLDFLYDERKGGLYFNENGSDKGFGDGGIIAILKSTPDLTSDNLEFI